MASITLSATDGSGTFSAYIAKPAKLPAPAILLIQEIFGVNADMRKKCDDFAAQGYIAVCPDLFWRQEPGVDITDKTKAEWDKAMQLLSGFDNDKGIADLKAALDAIRAMPDCNGKVGTVGYCLGGKLAFLMAARSSVDASVGYYGIQLDEFAPEAAHIRKPTLLHMAELDKFSSPEKREKALSVFKNYPEVTALVYPGVDHAFARINGEHYDAAAATLANERTDDFFAAQLKGDA
jgi:carboxymethylenebutenolidase